jgi:hypothetical protein
VAEEPHDDRQRDALLVEAHGFGLSLASITVSFHRRRDATDSSHRTPKR